MKFHLERLFNNINGQAETEFALIISLIVIVSVGAMLSFGEELKILYDTGIVDKFTFWVE